MKIEVLGTGCAKCRKQFNEATDAVEAAGVDAQVVKVEKIDEIMERGVMMTPSLVIDGKVVSSGKVLRSPQIVSLLRSAADGGGGDA